MNTLLITLLIFIIQNKNNQLLHKYIYKPTRNTYEYVTNNEQLYYIIKSNYYIFYKNTYQIYSLEHY